MLTTALLLALAPQTFTAVQTPSRGALGGEQPTSPPPVVWTRITDDASPVRGYGSGPALDGGEVAFLGEDRATGVDGIWRAAADGTGGYTLIVDQNTAIPNVPGETFLYLQGPEIHAGEVHFTGGHQVLLSAIRDGIYSGSGGALAVRFDATGLPPDPNPAQVMVDPTGAAFRHVGSNPSNLYTANFPYLLPQAGPPVRVGDGPLPGGGTMVGLEQVDDNPALEGGLLAFAGTVNHPMGVDGGIYTVDLATQDVDLVVNWTHQLPGTSLPFEYFNGVDTDGSDVAFIGGSGFMGFGGFQGLYKAPAGAGGAAVIEVLAEIGQPTPDGRDVFAGFDGVSIGSGMVIVQATLGSVFAPTGSGIYAVKDGELHEILRSGDVVDGDQVRWASTGFRSLDGKRLAVQVVLLDPVNPSSASRIHIWVARLAL